MAEPRTLDKFADAMRALLAWTAEARVPVLIIGGVAVSMLGEPRTPKADRHRAPSTMPLIAGAAPSGVRGGERGNHAHSKCP